MTQLALFSQGRTDREDVCRRRHGMNPESLAAHRRTPKEDRYAKILDLLRIVRDTGLTCDELSQRLSVHPNQISGRITELRLMGKIRKTDQRRQTQTGSWAAVYVLAEGAAN